MKSTLKISIFALCILHFAFISAQTVNGKVEEIDNTTKKIKAVPFASVYWLNTIKGTTTDKNGNFSLAYDEKDGNKIVVSFVGYRNDTIEIRSFSEKVNILLVMEGTNLQEVEIIQQMGGSYVSLMSPLKAEMITSVGLCQLACCNLAESFENSATVDVGYTDAVSGARQIQMLGLTGLYSQMLYENMPFLKGVGTTIMCFFILFGATKLIVVVLVLFIAASVMIVPMSMTTAIGIGSIHIDEILVIGFAIMFHNTHAGSPYQKSEQTNNG